MHYLKDFRHFKLFIYFALLHTGLCDLCVMDASLVVSTNEQQKIRAISKLLQIGTDQKLKLLYYSSNKTFVSETKIMKKKDQTKKMVSNYQLIKFY